VLGVWDVFGLHYTVIAVVMFGFGAGMLVVVSLMTPAPDYERISDYTFTREIFQKDLLSFEVPWYEDVRYQSAGLIALMGATIVYFW